MISGSGLLPMDRGVSSDPYVILKLGGKKKKSGAVDSPYGLALIAASLLMDMFTGGLQDKVKVRTKELNPLVSGPKRPSMHESMLWTNASGARERERTCHVSCGARACGQGEQPRAQ